MSAGICTVDGCCTKAHTGGYCHKHYRRVRVYGDPNYVPHPKAQYAKKYGLSVPDYLDMRGRKEKICKVCGERKGDGDFLPNAALCRQCKRDSIRMTPAQRSEAFRLRGKKIAATGWGLSVDEYDDMVAAGDRICGKCRRRLPVDSFYGDSVGNGRCAECSRRWAKKYRKENIAKYRARAAIEREKNRERRRVDQANRKALMRRVAGKITVSQVEGLISSQAGRCFYCFGEISLGNKHIEHKTPLSRGGDNSAENIVLSCCGCNLSKHAKTAEEFIMVVAI